MSLNSLAESGVGELANVISDEQLYYCPNLGSYPISPANID